MVRFFTKDYGYIRRHMLSLILWWRFMVNFKFCGLD